MKTTVSSVFDNNEFLSFYILSLTIGEIKIIQKKFCQQKNQSFQLKYFTKFKLISLVLKIESPAATSCVHSCVLVTWTGETRFEQDLNILYQPDTSTSLQRFSSNIEDFYKLHTYRQVPRKISIRKNKIWKYILIIFTW